MTANTRTGLIEHLNTTELRVGDVVWHHGGRFKLTECLIDAERADFLARASVGYEHAEKDGPDTLARYMERETNLRSFRGAYLGPSHDGVECSIPAGWRDGWNVQGNHLAHWIVELPRGAATTLADVTEIVVATKVDPADLYVRGVEFIALNDEPELLDAKQIEGQISTVTVSEVLNVPAKRVARDVVRVRKALNKDAVSGKTSKRILSAATAAYKAEIAAADWKVEGGTDRDTSWTKSIGHAVKDSKQREIGNVAVIWEEKGGPQNEHGVTPRPAGFYVRIWSTRDGKHFGAIPNSTRLDTLDAAKQAADEKLLAARQRTVREAAKGIVRGAK